MTLKHELNLSNDLNWVYNAPSLVYTPQDCINLTKLLSVDQHHLVSFDCRQYQSRNLGSYYENLVFQLLVSASNLSGIQRNIKVYADKITLGEMDFVGHSKTADFHLECAIKFYLRINNGSELSHFIGPGKKDRLDIKYERMINHQLILSKTAPGKVACADLNLTPTLSLFLLQGFLFHPFDEFSGVPSERLHPSINPEHLQGWWLRQSELNKLKFTGYFVIMNKPNWLQVQPKLKIDFNQLSHQLAELRNPVLVARLDLGEQELDRGFIVPDAW